MSRRRRWSWRVRLAHAAEYAGAAVFYGVLRLLPLAARIRLTGRVFGLIVARGPLRHRIERNLALVRPDLRAGDRAEFAREVGDNFGRTVAEFAFLPDLRRAGRRWTVSGESVIRDLVADGRGAVLISAHFGNWDIVRLAAAELGLPAGMLYRPFNNPWIGGFQAGRIPLAGGPGFAKGVAGLKAAIDHAQRGGGVLTLVDQRIGRAPRIPFMGEPAETQTTIVELAARRGVAVVPARASRLPDGFGFEVRFEPPIPPGDGAAMMAAANQRIEAWIDEDPAQWLWLHQRWRRFGGRPRSGR